MTWLLIALGGIALVLVLAAAGSGWAHRVLYSWRRARHLVAVTQAEPVPAPEYGSMILAEERDWRGYTHPMGPDWREQTAADLSPEALDSDVQPDPYIDAIAAEHVTEFDPYDSGPGVLSSLPPGPDPERLCGPEQPHEKPAGTESAGSGLTRLADTGDVMDAALLAEVSALLRAQDDDAAEYLSRLRSSCAQYRLDLAGALA